MEVRTHEREKVQLKKKEIAIIRMIPVFHLLSHTPGGGHQLIEGHYVRIDGFGTLLKGATAVLWRCSGSSPYHQNTFHVFVRTGN